MRTAVTAPHRLDRHPLHLGAEGTVAVEPEFTGGTAWYEGYAARHQGETGEGRLVSLFRFAENWTSWERHPAGAEVVLCVAGEIVLHQQQPDGAVTRTRLKRGEYAINPPGIWHTADVDGEAEAIFITAGAGTEHRPR